MDHRSPRRMGRLPTHQTGTHHHAAWPPILLRRGGGVGDPQRCANQLVLSQGPIRRGPYWLKKVSAILPIREAAEYGSRLKAGTTSLRMRRLDHFRKAYDMTTLSPSGFLTVGAAHLEYRMIGPSPESAPTIVMLHEGLGSAGLWGDFPEKLQAA